MSAKQAIRIRHRQRDGYHIFTSPDVYGLYIARRDLAAAKLQLAGAIEELLRRNEHRDCRIELPAELAGTDEPPRETQVSLNAA